MGAVPAKLAPILHGLSIGRQLGGTRIETKRKPTRKTQITAGDSVGEAAVLFALLRPAGAAEHVVRDLVRQGLAQQPLVSLVAVSAPRQLIADVDLMVA